MTTQSPAPDTNLFSRAAIERAIDQGVRKAKPAPLFPRLLTIALALLLLTAGACDIARTWHQVTAPVIPKQVTCVQVTATGYSCS